MDTVDIAIIALVFLSAVIGVFRGFVREVLSFISWVAAFYVAWIFRGEVASYLTSIEPEFLRNAVAVFLIFITVLIAFSLFNYVIIRLMNSAGLSGTDRLLGVLFGIARGYLIVMILIDLVGITPFINNKLYKRSLLIPHFQSATDWVKGYLPEGIKESLNIAESTTYESEVINSESVPIEINKIIKGE